MQARYDLASALNASGKREEAADALLDIIRRNRAWNDEAARKQLLKFFEAWGFDDPATAAARRKLSSILFSSGGCGELEALATRHPSPPRPAASRQRDGNPDRGGREKRQLDAGVRAAR